VAAAAGCVVVRTKAVAAAVLPNNCSMDSRRVAERVEEVLEHGRVAVGAKADAVASDAIRAMEVFMLFFGVSCLVLLRWCNACN